MIFIQRTCLVTSAGQMGVKASLSPGFIQNLCRSI